MLMLSVPLTEFVPLRLALAVLPPVQPLVLAACVAAVATAGGGSLGPPFTRKNQNKGSYYP